MAKTVTQSAVDKKQLSLRQAMAKRERIEAQMKKLSEQLNPAKRKLEDRRKILVGALVLKAVQTNPHQQQWLDALLDKSLKRPDERALFGLPPLAAAGPSQAPADAPAKAAPAQASAKPQEKAAPAAPVKYPVCIFKADDGFGAWMVDFPQSGTKGTTEQQALERATVNIRNATSGGSLRPASDEKTARQEFKLHKGQQGGPVPDCTVHWVEVE